MAVTYHNSAPFALFLLFLSQMSLIWAKRVGNWTLDSFIRKCDNDGSTCQYSFTIIEDSFTHMPCQFAVQRGDRVANETDFQAMKCEPGDHDYAVNGGWDLHGYMSLVVWDKKWNHWAFFALEDVDIETGKGPVTQTRPAYVRGTWTDDDRPVVERENAAEQDHWQILNMIRDFSLVNPFGELDGHLKMTFDLRQSNGLTIHCGLYYRSPKGVDIQFWSFYGLQCAYNNWTVSWGYENDTDAAIMTVVNPSKTMEAFFGYEAVNVANGGGGPPIYLDDTQPSLALPCKCG